MILNIYWCITEKTAIYWFEFTIKSLKYENYYNETNGHVKKYLLTYAANEDKSACASLQSDQIFHCLHEETLYAWLSKHAPSEDSDQTAQTRSRIWIFTGRTYPKVRFLTLLL